MSFLEVVQWISMLLILPSSLLTVFIIYIIHRASPKAMAKYKYVLIIMTLVCYNFDFTVSFAVAPRNMPGIVGAQLAGVVASVFPAAGPYLMFGCFLSLAMQISSSTVGFCYREHTVTVGFENRIHYFIRAMQMIVLIVTLWLLFPCYFMTTNTEEESREYLVNNSLAPCDRCGVFLVNQPITIQVGGLYSVVFVAMAILFIIKSIYRISCTLANHKNMSIATVRLQKMLLKALIWQSAMPFVLIIIPVLVLMANMIIFPLNRGVRPTNEFRLSVTGLAIATPSLFTVAHIFCVVYFTSPYRTYVSNLLRINFRGQGLKSRNQRRNTTTTEVG